MVAIARSLAGVYGARMTGGGFGGCVVALVDRAAAATVVREIARKYKSATGTTPDVWPTGAGAGVGAWPVGARHDGSVASPVQSVARRVGDCLGRPQRATVARAGRDAGTGAAARIRRELLSLSRQRARAAVSATPAMRRPSRSTTISPRSPGIRDWGSGIRSRSPEPDSRSRLPNRSPLPAAPPESRLLLARPERGLCRVLCFSPRHDLTLPRMETPEIRQVVDLWADEYAAAAALPWARYAMAFENRGTLMGASNPHPHGQFWATESVPNEPARERLAFDEYRAAHGRCLLCDYVAARGAARRAAGVRERRISSPWYRSGRCGLSKRSSWRAGTSRRIDALDNVERDALADVLKRLTTRYDNLFETPFPYSMGVHQQPMRDAGHDWHLHSHFYPPLLRSATIRKFMVGFETARIAAARFFARGRRGAAAGGGGDALSHGVPAPRRDR